MSRRKGRQQRRAGRRRRPGASGAQAGTPSAHKPQGGALSPPEVDRLVERYARLKQDLVAWVQRRHHDTIVEQARSMSADGLITDAELVRATEAILHQGPEVIDAYLSARPGLRGPDRVLVRRWRGGFKAIFRLQGRDGRVLRLHNLVDDLDYPTAISSDDPRAWRGFDQVPFIVAHLLPLGPLWTLSGSQRPLDPTDPRLAHGLAATMAQDDPALFFRNPDNLAQGWDSMRRQHEAFVARFDGSWVVGPPAEIQQRHQEMLADRVRRRRAADGTLEDVAPDLQDAVRATEERLERFELPAPLMEAESVGMVSHPQEGLVFCPDFARLLASFEDPALGRDAEHREVVLGYLESDTIPPEVIEAVAALDPSRAGALIAAVLERPSFDWDRDGDALLRRLKPGFFERARLPSILPLPKRMVEGLLALRALESGATEGEAAGSGDSTSPEEEDEGMRPRANGPRGA